MCLIAISKNGRGIDKESLETAFVGNSHGAGFAYVDDGRVVIKKGFFTFDAFYEEYQKIIGKPCLIHFRWKTSGEKDEANCHPFEVNENVCFAHNGVISGFNRVATMSDTANFNEDIIKPLTKDSGEKEWWKNDGFKWFIEAAIGTNNKLVFFSKDETFVIFNEALGEWNAEKDMWFSNDSYRVKKHRNPPVTSYYHQHSYSNYCGVGGNCNNVAPKSNLIDKPKIISTPVDSENFWDLSEAELKEIDDKLEKLNS